MCATKIFSLPEPRRLSRPDRAAASGLQSVTEIHQITSIESRNSAAGRGRRASGRRMFAGATACIGHSQRVCSADTTDLPPAQNVQVKKMEILELDHEPGIGKPLEVGGAGTLPCFTATLEGPRFHLKGDAWQRVHGFA